MIGLVSWLSEIIEIINEFYINLVKLGEDFIGVYSDWGPLAWVFAAWLESIFPVLMLSVITWANIGAAKLVLGPVFGFIAGFGLSYVGTTLGAITMFSFWRYTSDKIRYFRNRKKEKLETEEVDVVHESNQGVIGLFTISALPLVPSSIINFTYAFTKMKTSVFIKTTAISKFIMMLLMSFFADSFSYLFSDLGRAIITMIVIGIVFFLLNKFEKNIINFVKSIAYKSKYLRSLDEKEK